MEQILKIEEMDFKITEDDWCTYTGYEITTTQQIIRIGIDNSQSCCEDFGCIITNDEHSEFIGAELKEISLTDTVLNNRKIEPLEYLDAGGTMFVNIETDRGLLQFVAYNAHNGYYGHDAVLVSRQLNNNTTL